MSIVNFGMAGLVMAQGVHQGSKAALVMGAVIGGLYTISGYMINVDSLVRGYGLAAITSFALSGRMGHYVLK